VSARPVLVLGATGGQGGAVAAALLRARRPVRALVRDPASPGARKLAAAGASLAAGEFTDAGALAAAMRGADAAFALTTPFESGTDAELRQGRAIIHAATAASLPCLVFSSVASALDAPGVPHFASKAAVERTLTASDLPHIIVAPTYFYDNALGGRADLLDGVLEFPLPAARPLQQLDRSDLGAFVELILRDPGAHLSRRIELASDAPTPEQMTGSLAVALRRPVRYRQTSVAEVRRGSADMGAMWEFLNGTGYQVDIAALHRDNPGIPWTTFSSWAQRTFNKDAQ
jgi:uncharacterized protein YbjT (DUF2867 family)